MSEHELHHDDNKLITQRREKLAVLREQGVPFPNDVVREHKAADLQTQYGEYEKPWFEENPVEVTVAGRMMLKRVMGKASFATLSDTSGRIQLYTQKNVLGDAVFEA